MTRLLLSTPSPAANVTTGRTGTTKAKRTSPAKKGRVWYPAFLAVVALTGNVTEACRAAKIDRKTAYLARQADELFAVAWADALDAAADRLEQEAVRRAVDGVEEPVFHKGDQIATVRRYSDTLLIFLLKGVRPEKYRERFEVKHAIPAGDVQRLLAQLGEFVPAERREAFLAELEAAAGGGER